MDLHSADKFIGEGLTYDDVLLVPAYSEVLPRDVNITSKFSRNISVELSLPKDERSASGRDFVAQCRMELDRLIEQSPNVPLHIVKTFGKLFEKSDFYKPDILQITGVEVYKDNEKEKPKGIFLNVDEINNALERRLISIHSKIISQFSTVDKEGNKVVEKYQSKAGRFYSNC